MLKKTITYTDYNDVERTEDFYFNLTKSEIAEMELSINGGLSKMLEKIIAEKNVSKIIEIFKELILKSYGEKTLDGKRFIKSKELSEAFAQTEAYNILFMELATSPDLASAFVNGIVPRTN